MIIAISDLHLGFRDDCGNRMNKQDALLKFLDLCDKSRISDLVLVGDVLDLWRRNNCEIFSLPVKYYKDPDKLKNYLDAEKSGLSVSDPVVEKVFRNQKILQKLAGMSATVHYVIGNHDYFILKLHEQKENFLPFRISKTLRLSDSGKNYFFTHGYEMDVLANDELKWSVETYEKLCEKFCYMDDIRGAAASIGFDLTVQLSKTLDIIKNSPEKREKGSDDGTTFTDLFAQSQAAFLMLGMHPKDCLVYGHTHYPYVNAEGTVANTGSWCYDCPGDRQFTYVKIDNGVMSSRSFEQNPTQL
ncbi:MAG: metallophosphoesterase [Methanoregula sp.]|nr:metallophosphoesterase [Methanoregula sp.]